MKVSRVDALGRIVVPIDMRRRHGLVEGAEVEIHESGENIILKRHGDVCCNCNVHKPIVYLDNICLCKRCFNNTKHLIADVELERVLEADIAVNSPGGMNIG